MGKSEVELKKQSKTKRRKNQEMELKEKWICPDAEVQRFTPQENVATCYRITIRCNGANNVIVENNNSNPHRHSIHQEISFILRSNNPPTDSQIKSETNFRDGKTGDKNAPGHLKTEGHIIEVGGEWHFTISSTGWYSPPVPSPENAS